MYDNLPHVLLFSEASRRRDVGRRSTFDGYAPAVSGRWRFLIEAIDGSYRFEAADDEPSISPIRLQLLPVVRGLEWLDEPSRVTLLTPSRYISHGLRFGLPEWRETDWQWERFGSLEPVTNADLWRRIDQAAKIHSLSCRQWRFDLFTDEASSVPPPHFSRRSTEEPWPFERDNGYRNGATRGWEPPTRLPYVDSDEIPPRLQSISGW